MQVEQNSELLSLVTKLMNEYEMSMSDVALEAGIDKGNLSNAIKGHRRADNYIQKMRALLTAKQSASASFSHAQPTYQQSSLSVLAGMDADFKRYEQEQRRFNSVLKRAMRIIGPSLFQSIAGTTPFDIIYREEIRRVGNREVTIIRVADRILYQRRQSYQHLTTGRNYQSLPGRSQRQQISPPQKRFLLPSALQTTASQPQGSREEEEIRQGFYNEIYAQRFR